MSATEIVASTTARYVILRRLTPPSTGVAHSCVVEHAQHLGFDDRHWHVEFDGVDKAAWLAACAGFGIEPPTT